MIGSATDPVIAFWKSAVDPQFLPSGPFSVAREKKVQNGIRFRVCLVTIEEEHDLRQWEVKLSGFLSSYGFDVTTEYGVQYPGYNTLDDADLVIVFPLTEKIRTFCMHYAQQQTRASRMVVCVPDGDGDEIYCRSVREDYGVETVALPMDKLKECQQCRFGIDIIRHCADFLMRKVNATLSRWRIEKTVVVLIHGIRTRAGWQGEVKHALEQEGLLAIPTNYNKFDVVRFLLPWERAKLAPLRKIESNVRFTRSKFPDGHLSVIAHSFGTYIMGKLLLSSEHRFDRIALCGSVLRSEFDFETAAGRFSKIVNEVGCSDIWPTVAAKIAWGYGPTGSFGFNEGNHVTDRKHAAYGHSHFLNKDFCNRFWVPYFCNFSDYDPGDVTATQSRWVRILDSVPCAKTIVWGPVVLLVCLAFWLIGRSLFAALRLMS